MACGIKPSDAPDLALVATANGRRASAAGVFTTNLATAAPVIVSRDHLRDGHAAAVVVSSGNANAATGAAGLADARRMCALAGEGLGVDPGDVLVCSTGLIGIPLPMAALEAGIPKLAAGLGPDGPAGAAAADAMLTTDTVRKEATAGASADGRAFTVGGMAKGAAMLAPAMATMLAVLTTDAAVEPRALHQALDLAVQSSFNSLLVDGATSTNDTVVALANGAAMGGAPPIGFGGSAFHALVDALGAVCGSLSDQMAADAEGATKLARARVHGARTAADARRAARAVAGSQLVQCSLNGEDPYWGRVLSELGASGAFIDPDRVDIAYNGVTVCRDGVAAEHDPAAVAAGMAARDIVIDCELHLGRGEATVTFTDLSYAYIDENRGTS
jgi:glutamate N-acetyltransferase/amino-acid N-acetyltransferase